MSRYFQRGHAAMRMARKRREAALPLQKFADLPRAVAFPKTG